jgi:hypothetical protein
MTDDYTLDPELGRSDPLVIVSLDRLFTEVEARAAANPGKANAPREPLHAYLGPDPLHKYDPDDEHPDEHPTQIALPAEDAEGRVQGRFGAMSFVDYLRTNVERGGFWELGEGADRETLTRGVVPF